jgi:hypothetical protein
MPSVLQILQLNDAEFGQMPFLHPLQGTGGF